jgi:hypothetical protein
VTLVQPATLVTLVLREIPDPPARKGLREILVLKVRLVHLDTEPIQVIRVPKEILVIPAPKVPKVILEIAVLREILVIPAQRVQPDLKVRKAHLDALDHRATLVQMPILVTPVPKVLLAQLVLKVTLVPLVQMVLRDL